MQRPDADVTAKLHVVRQSCYASGRELSSSYCLQISHSIRISYPTTRTYWAVSPWSRMPQPMTTLLLPAPNSATKCQWCLHHSLHSKLRTWIPPRLSTTRGFTFNFSNADAFARLEKFLSESPLYSWKWPTSIYKATRFYQLPFMIIWSYDGNCRRCDRLSFDSNAVVSNSHMASIGLDFPSDFWFLGNQLCKPPSSPQISYTRISCPLHHRRLSYHKYLSTIVHCQCLVSLSQFHRKLWRRPLGFDNMQHVLGFYSAYLFTRVGR